MALKTQKQIPPFMWLKLESPTMSSYKIFMGCLFKLLLNNAHRPQLFLELNLLHICECVWILTHKNSNVIFNLIALKIH